MIEEDDRATGPLCDIAERLQDRLPLHLLVAVRNDTPDKFGEGVDHQHLSALLENRLLEFLHARSFHEEGDPVGCVKPIQTHHEIGQGLI